jgi:hypothetical protein
LVARPSWLKQLLQMGAGISEQVWIDSWPGTAGGELLLDSVTVYPMAGNDLALQATLKGTRYREDTGLTERQFPDAGMRRAPPGAFALPAAWILPMQRPSGYRSQRPCNAVFHGGLRFNCLIPLIASTSAT